MGDSSASLDIVIDQGGHASRAVIFNPQGEILSIGSVEIETHHPGPDRVEHDPEALIRSIRDAITAAVNPPAVRTAGIGRMGIATQRSSIVCWDRNTGAALSPVISWQDRRTAETIPQYAAQSGAIHSLTGLVLSPHYGATKIRWCLEHLPEVRQAYRQHRLACGPLSSYILFRIVNERPFVVDPANASRTLLWNYRTCDWAPELLNLFAVPREILPQPVPSRHACGHVGIAGRNVPVNVVTGDQSAALYAFGRPRADTTYINIGTGAFLQRPVGAHPLESEHLLSSIVWQSGNEAEFVLEGTVNGAGSALQHFADEAGIADQDLHAEITAGMSSVSAPPLFLNGVSGLGSPFWDADFPTRFVGEGTRMEKLVAVIESIVFLISANLDAMSVETGRSARLVVTGGLSAVDGLCQRLADLGGTRLERPQIQEATAHGVAWLLSSHTADPVSSTAFDPVANDPLQQRYRQWLKLMTTGIESWSSRRKFF